jgi:hypothetical protein
MYDSGGTENAAYFAYSPADRRNLEEAEMKRNHIVIRSLLIFCLTSIVSLSTSAALAIDTDGDLIEDSIDNCVLDPNGPVAVGNVQSNQIDTDGDGTPCDTDFDQNGVITGSDFSIFLENFNTGNPLTDLNGDGVTSGADFTIFVSSSNSGPGPSGLACADPTIDIAAGDPPCVP